MPDYTEKALNSALHVEGARQSLQGLEALDINQLERIFLLHAKVDSTSTDTFRITLAAVILKRNPHSWVLEDLLRFALARLEERKIEEPRIKERQIGEAGQHLSLARIEN